MQNPERCHDTLSEPRQAPDVDNAHCMSMCWCNTEKIFISIESSTWLWSETTRSEIKIFGIGTQKKPRFQQLLQTEILVTADSKKSAPTRPQPRERRHATTRFSLVPTNMR